MSTEKKRYHIDLVGGGGIFSRATKAMKGGKLRGRTRPTSSRAPSGPPKRP